MPLAMNIGVPILLYHSIDDSGSPISISSRLFRQQVRYLYENGFRSASIPEALERVQIRRGAFLQREKIVVITFDDGYQNVYTHALPILQRYGFKATVFLTSGLCGQQVSSRRGGENIAKLKLLTWHEAKEMSRCGVEFGAHTMTHPRLTNLPVELAREEILQSKNIIEHNLGKSVDFFAYPFGAVNDKLRAIVNSTFSAACTITPGLLTEKTDPHDLPRVSLCGEIARVLPTHLLLCQLPHLYIGWKHLVAIPRNIRHKYAIED